MSDAEQIAFSVSNLDLSFADKKVLHNVSLEIPKNQVTAIIGPSGCGKSVLLRCFNRMNDIDDACSIEGNISLFGEDIYGAQITPSVLRQRVGLVFQQPNPFPLSVLENVTYGLKVSGLKDKRLMMEVAEESLKKVALWNEVKDQLHTNALQLSGGQQQRLMLARALAIEPQIILLDEPTSALDPISTLTIEELIHSLKQQYTVILVTHNMQQAARVSDKTAFLYMGELIEYNDTNKMFTSPENSRTEDYITGRYG